MLFEFLLPLLNFVLVTWQVWASPTKSATRRPRVCLDSFRQLQHTWCKGMHGKIPKRLFSDSLMHKNGKACRAPKIPKMFSSTSWKTFETYHLPLLAFSVAQQDALQAQQPQPYCDNACSWRLLLKIIMSSLPWISPATPSVTEALRCDAGIWMPHIPLNWSTSSSHVVTSPSIQ